ncbi:MAG: hypothetical protein HG425_001700 [Propionibacterium sp.]|uniref:Uncharacterized protein n=1 Tax=Arachnia rubra TaxID=1547448 RepID=A0ABX7Y3X2_9ACTN|nr:hypothetical protein [Propionibacterium sp.]MBB1576016.1 hypothetical protein [Propionibacterium sp.]QUC07772.1 hypothetical protein J5A65_12740 [Arachnia rubra]
MPPGPLNDLGRQLRHIEIPHVSNPIPHPSGTRTGRRMVLRPGR